MIKAIIFDFDGTLADTLWIYVASYKKVLAQFNINFTDTEIVTQCFGRTEEAICEALGINDVDGFRDGYFTSLRELASKVVLFDGVKEFLDFAQGDEIKLSLASFAQRWYIDIMVGHLGIADYFKPILSFNDVTSPKPHPEILFKCAEVMGVETSECLVIGDSRGDIAMGKEAGSVTAIFIPEGNTRYYDFDTLRQSNPDLEISSYAQLRRLITAGSSLLQ